MDAPATSPDGASSAPKELDAVKNEATAVPAPDEPQSGLKAYLVSLNC